MVQRGQRVEREKKRSASVYFFFAASSSAFCRKREILVNMPKNNEICTNLGGPRLALALVLSVCPLVAESAVRLEFPLLLGDLAGRLSDVGVREGNLLASCLGLEIVGLIYTF